MGGTSKTSQNSFQSSQLQRDPYAPTAPALNALSQSIYGQTNQTGLTGAESGAISGLAGSFQPNQFLPQINNAVSGLLNAGQGVNANLNEYRAGLLPYTKMDTNPYSNEAFTKATGYLTDDITNRIKSQYAGAGYSPVRAGNFQGSLAEGVSRGVAPAWLQASNDLENRKLGAMASMYGAGNTSAGLLGTLMPSAIGAAGTAQGMNQSNADAPFLRLLETEAQRRGIPLQNMANLASLIVPMAQVGGTAHSSGYGRQDGSQTMSGAQQFATIASGVGNLMPKFPISMGG